MNLLQKYVRINFTGLEYGPVASSSEQCNKVEGSVRDGKFSNRLREWRLQKKGFATCS
jgi:hypothetical protein